MIPGQLFGRQCSLAVGATTFAGLRVVFEVNRKLNRWPDPAEITIYNCRRETRDGFAKGDQVRLVAGYEGSADLIFSGSVVQVQVRRDGADQAATLTCRDGDAAWQATAAGAFAANVPLHLALSRLAQAMGLTVPASTVAVVAGLTTRSAFAHATYAHRTLHELLSPQGLTWSIVDGALQVTPDDGATTEQAFVLTPQTGLVGSPTREGGVPNAKGKTKAVKVRAMSLLLPSLRPGRRVELQSQGFAGAFRIDELLHKGDTHGQDWYSDLTLRGV